MIMQVALSARYKGSRNEQERPLCSGIDVLWSAENTAETTFEIRNMKT
jgi:hypothetical protein